VTDELLGIRLKASVVDRDTALEWIVPSTGALTVQTGANPGAPPTSAAQPIELVGLVTLDPRRVGPGDRPLDDGAWSVLIRWSGLGITASGSLRFRSTGEGRPTAAIWPALLGRPPRWAVPRPDADGHLQISIGGTDRLPARIDRSARRLIHDGGSVALTLPIATDRIGVLARGKLVLTNDTDRHELPAALVGALGEVTLSVADVRAAGSIRPARYDLTAHVGGPDAPGLPVGAAHVRADGRFTVVGLRKVPALARLRARAEWWVHAGSSATRSGALAAYRRLPQWTKDAIRGRVRRVNG